MSTALTAPWRGELHPDAVLVLVFSMAMTFVAVFLAFRNHLIARTVLERLRGNWLMHEGIIITKDNVAAILVDMAIAFSLEISLQFSLGWRASIGHRNVALSR